MLRRKVASWGRAEEAIGLLFGLLGVALEWLAKILFGGRLLGNPLPLTLSLGAAIRQLGRRFLYIHWQAPVRHLAFVTAVATAAAFAAEWYGAKGEGPRRGHRAGQVAAGVVVVGAAVAEIDALVILFHFSVAGLISVWLAGWIARRLTRRSFRRG